MRPISDIVQALTQIEGAGVSHVDDSFLIFRIFDLGAILSIGGGWDHIAVSHIGRTPTYGEMKLIKRLCFDDHEWAYELHPPPDKYVSVHFNALHLWRPQEGPWRPPPIDLMMNPAAFEKEKPVFGPPDDIRVIVNGIPLDVAQTMTFWVALNNFAMDLTFVEHPDECPDCGHQMDLQLSEQDRKLNAAYLARLSEIIAFCGYKTPISGG